jgi:hypothetical protein
MRTILHCSVAYLAAASFDANIDFVACCRCAGDLLPNERLLLSHQLCPWATHDGRLHFPDPEAAEASSQTAAA